jgi:hypothetical protein
VNDKQTINKINKNIMRQHFYISLIIVLLGSVNIISAQTITKKTITRIEIDPSTGDTVRITETTTSTDERNNEENQKSIVSVGGNVYDIFFTWNKRRKTYPHWAGFGMGFVNYDDKDIPYGDAMNSKSLYYSLNLKTYHVQLGTPNLLLVSGIGTDWFRFRYDNVNSAITKVDGIAKFVPAPEGIDYKKSKLSANYLTIPLLIEYQYPARRRSFHISFGVVGYLKYYSKSTVFYYIDGRKYKDSMGRDLNIRPVDMKLRAQVGLGGLSIVGRYSPFSMFDAKGPDLKSYSLGLQWNFL